MKKLFIFAFILAATFALPAMAEAVHAPKDWGWFFQDAPSELGDRMVDFHNYIFVIITAITFLVLGLMAYIVVKFRARAGREASKTTHNTMIEIIWTVIPLMIVIAIIVPSMKLLYYVDRVEEADLTVKVVGYQWYWGYELPEYGVAEFESRMIPEKDLKKGDLRLLEVDQELVLPVGKTVRVLLTSDPNGVIHAWGIPSLKFKRDTIPGRVNEGWIKIEKEGVYYGQCYELCGPEHAFMPIKIRGVSQEEFNDWVTKMGGTVPGLVSVAEAEVGAGGAPLAIDAVEAAPAVEAGEQIVEAVEAPKEPTKEEITNKEGI